MDEEPSYSEVFLKAYREAMRQEAPLRDVEYWKERKRSSMDKVSKIFTEAFRKAALDNTPAKNTAYWIVKKEINPMSGIDDVKDKILRLDIAARHRDKVIESCASIMADFAFGNFDCALQSMGELEFHLQAGKGDYEKEKGV